MVDWEHEWLEKVKEKEKLESQKYVWENENI